MIVNKNSSIAQHTAPVPLHPTTRYHALRPVSFTPNADPIMFSAQSPFKPLPNTIRMPAFPWQVNETGFIKAGPVLKLIDVVGSEAAMAFLKSPDDRVVTASVDRTNFDASIRPWEMIEMSSQVTQVWESSLESQVVIRARSIITGESHDVATSHLVFVALNPKTREKVSFKPYQTKTYEDRQLAKSAELRKKNRKEEGKVAPFIPIDKQSDQPVQIERLMTKFEANNNGNVFGGIILEILDEAGEKAAKRQNLNESVVGVRLDRMSFIAPTYIGEQVEARAIVTKTWETSMEVQVEIEAVNPNTGDRRRVASCYLVYVGLGSTGKPAPVTPMIPKTDLQIQRAEAADRRRSIRKDEESKYNAAQPPSPNPWERFSDWLTHKVKRRARNTNR